MTEIAPFNGIRYDPDAVGELSKVVAPPYDVISDTAREELEEASPYNVVRLILGQDFPGDDERSNKYTRARALLEAWLAAGVLRIDDAPALYVYEQRYRVQGRRLIQRGVLGAVQLDDSSAGGVLPHERTYSDIVEDRLQLLRATATNLDCIFCVYDAPDHGAGEVLEALARSRPLVRLTTEDGIEHRLWALREQRDIDTVSRAIEKATVVIADGHHRWRTALQYQEERRASEGPGLWDAQLMYLVDASAGGPTLLPIHRVIDGMDASRALELLAPAFEIQRRKLSDPERVARELAKRREQGRIYAMTDGTTVWWLTVSDKDAERSSLPTDHSSAWRDLDVSVLHSLVFERLLGGVQPRFMHSATEAVTEVTEARASLAFLLAPMPFDSVRAVAEAGEAMPQKSTFFVPKPLTGLVMRPLE